MNTPTHVADPSGVKVLVIDDSNTIRRSAEIFLAQGGHQVVLAEDGFDALAKVKAEDPAFEPNGDFWRDMFNIVVGVAWQTSLVLLPILMVIRKWNALMIAGAVVVVCSVILKLTWYDNLDAREARAAALRPVA